MLIVGDSAHAVPPSVGQGANISLHDTLTLALSLSQLIDEEGLTYEIFEVGESPIERIVRVTKRTQMGNKIRKETTSGTPQAEKWTRLWESET